MNRPQAQLVAQAKRGDRDALVTLLSTAAPQVRRALVGSIAPRFQSMLSEDDVMQQAYADAFLHIQRFEYAGPGSFERWLTMLAKRACVDAIRQLQAAKRGGRHQPLTSDDAFTANLIDLVTGISRTPSRLAAGAEAGELLHHAIAQLPLVYQSVIKRMEIEAMPAADVAEELGRSVGAVYMIRTRAYDRLREILGSASRYFSDGA